jgi:RHS repeat-associated protein
MNRGERIAYLAGDHLGSTSVAMNEDQTLRAKRTYRPYGAVYPAHQEGALPTDYEFTGQRHEEPGDLYQMGVRWYDPYLNRWVQPDTMVPNPGNPQSLNRYSYGLNNPVKYTDPTGHDVVVIGGAGADELTGGEDPYDDPASWEQWIEEYTGWTHEEFLEKWYNPWVAAKGDDELKMKIAQETGVAVFKWKAVPGGAQTGSATEAARALQKQIDTWGLKDVTAVGHSKGGLVLSSLMGLYEKGELDRGAVKNTVLVDAPQHPVGDWMRGIVDVDAAKAGVQAVILPGAVGCGPVSQLCDIHVQNPYAVLKYHLDHEVHGEMAWQVFGALNVYGDAHARVRTPW